LRRLADRPAGRVESGVEQPGLAPVVARLLHCRGWLYWILDAVDFPDFSPTSDLNLRSRRGIPRHGISLRSALPANKGRSSMPGVSHSRRQRPKCLIAGLAWHLLLILFVTVPAKAGAPRWIGGPQDRASTWEFKRSISIDEAVHSAG